MPTRRRRTYSRARRRRPRRRRSRRSFPAPKREQTALVGFSTLTTSAQKAATTDSTLSSLDVYPFRRALTGMRGMVEVSALLSGGQDAEVVVCLATALQGQTLIDSGDKGAFDPFDTAVDELPPAAVRGFNIIRYRRLAFGLPVGASKQVIQKNLRLTRRFRRIMDVSAQAQLLAYYRSTLASSIPISVAFDGGVYWTSME